MARQGNGMGAAWERHAMYESALSVLRQSTKEIEPLKPAKFLSPAYRSAVFTMRRHSPFNTAAF